MLQNIRDRLTGPLVWFVVGLICIPFAFWGIGTFNFADGDSVVAKVGDQKITQAEFGRAFNQRYQQYRSLLGDSFRVDLFDEGQFRRLILDDMVQESAMRQYALSQGYRAGDAMVRDLLLEIPAFQREGAFSKDAYVELLQRQGHTPESYESQVRQSLAIDQLRASVQTSSFATENDSWQVYRLENQERDISAVVVSAKNLSDKVSVTDEQIQAHYEANAERYRSPERVRLKYVRLDREQMPKAEAPAEAVLKALYDSEKDARFASPEERKARHILIAFGDDKSAARTKAQALADKARSGGDFAELAKANSTDSGSKEQGGDLGWVRKGVMVPEFESALFAMDPGTVSDPVESEFGWHVIALDEVRAASVKAFEDEAVQAELLEAYRSREAAEHFQTLSTQLEEAAFENARLEPVAEATGLEIQTSDWITRAQGEGIGAIEAVRTAAFSADVLEDDMNSRPVPVSPDAVVVVHRQEHEPARQLPLDEVRDQVREELVASESAKLASETAAALVKDAADKPLDELADARGLKVQFAGKARRGQAELDARVAQGVFAMPRPRDGKPVVSALEGDNGSVTVVALREVIDPEQPGKDALSALSSRVGDGLAGAEFAAYQQVVEDEVEVKMVNPPQTGTEEPAY